MNTWDKQAKGTQTPLYLCPKKAEENSKVLRLSNY